MGNPLLEQPSVHPTRSAPDRRGQLELILDRIFSQAAQEGTEIALLVCRLDEPVSLGLETGPEVVELIEKGLRGLFTEISGDDWFYAPDWQRGYLAIVADKAYDAVHREVLHMHRTWNHLRAEILPGQEQRATVSWGLASFPSDGVDRLTLLRAAEISWYLAKKDGGNSVGRRAPTDSVRLRIELSTVQGERLNQIASRLGTDTEELIQEAIDCAIRRYES